MIIEISKQFDPLTKSMGYSAKIPGVDSCWNSNRQTAINKLIERNKIKAMTFLVIDKREVK